MKKITQMNIIIFSKDRACQLDLLLNSMKRFFKEYRQYNIHVLYTYSSSPYQLSYNKLKNTYKNVHFSKEHNFKNDLISLINTNYLHTVFFVDDIVWKQKFTIECQEFNLFNKNDDILCLSLRLDPNLTYCYAYDQVMNTPTFDNEMKWNWSGKNGDFGYPMSLDGHIFRTREILPLLKELNYSNPNSLEGKLAENPIKKSKMICFKKAPIFNMPINKVQTHNNNRHGNISAEYLNDMFLKGYRISLSPLIGFNNYACHQEVDITLKRSLLNKFKYLFIQA